MSSTRKMPEHLSSAKAYNLPPAAGAAEAAAAQHEAAEAAEAAAVPEAAAAEAAEAVAVVVRSGGAEPACRVDNRAAGPDRDKG
jgi:hypothetical protein